jgi:hypothetical protein
MVIGAKTECGCDDGIADGRIHAHGLVVGDETRRKGAI